MVFLCIFLLFAAFLPFNSIPLWQKGIFWKDLCGCHSFTHSQKLTVLTNAFCTTQPTENNTGKPLGITWPAEKEQLCWFCLLDLSFLFSFLTHTNKKKPFKILFLNFQLFFKEWLYWSFLLSLTRTTAILNQRPVHTLLIVNHLEKKQTCLWCSWGILILLTKHLWSKIVLLCNVWLPGKAEYKEVRYETHWFTDSGLSS